ncbi:beta-1,4-mannosyl-glycoprotein 4-beta-N-acetylglucosaminyltransferase isoform X2 [Cephus cinctus]|uniref:Beta-1,4-mannosyl-glycoprotein 4-beta-N-acetylglucosaminyltransferase isoform X2 n=1 Tax=Cephus cinctus TaxID=211228 RepID=A0AAJ7C3T2_CEPCN|nr:beta-1,4-mannosyl-glycoprotein 4-beta-N-acetylglucosaminyltransferase isoform X2 [Cephus cinctus]
MQARLDGKLALLYTLLVLQVLIVVIYVASTPPPELVASTTRNSAKQESEPLVNRKSLPSYRTINSQILLKDISTFKLFEKYNLTSCWREGVNDRRMKKEDDLEKCVCNQGWHGSDCGQPEVVWRAIMASKQNIKLKKRKIARRIIHVFSINDYNSAIAEVIVEELYGVVDLFVIYDFSNAEDNFRHKLAKGLLRREQHKILYVNLEGKIRKPSRVISTYIWDRMNSVVMNLRDDDIYVTTEPEQILNSRALMFLKIYDGWPQPIGFRLRWSVFGFFWQHPMKTSITVGACTISFTREVYRSNSLILPKELGGEVTERDVLGLVIGDLNHYGGWYCYLCQDPANIITSLRHKTKSREIKFEKNIDVPFVEDLIGTGVFLDGKTNLLRAYKSRDPYYAPETVLNNTWKYDWLVENFYAKLDYY